MFFSFKKERSCILSYIDIFASNQCHNYHLVHHSEDISHSCVNNRYYGESDRNEVSRAHANCSTATEASLAAKSHAAYPVKTAPITKKKPYITWASSSILAFMISSFRC